MAPLSVAAASRPASIPTPSHTLRPFLSETPRTFPPAQDTFTVNTTNDTDASNPASGVCADSGGHCSIRAALDVANTINQTVTINIPAGTYSLTLGVLAVTDPAGVQFLGAGALSTTIGGIGTNDVLDVDTALFTCGPGRLRPADQRHAGRWRRRLGDQLNGTLVMTGAGITGSSGAGEGGAVLNNGQLWATNSGFSNNTVTDEGGAIYNEDGSARLSGDTFSGNSALSGGAIFNDNGPLSVDSSSFTSNSATDDEGGALYADDETTVTNDTFTSNTSTDATGTGEGGAIYASYGLEAVTGSTFNGNTAVGGDGDGYGGAIYDSSGLSTIMADTFTSNAVSGTEFDSEGGAVYDDDPGVTVAASTLTANTATNGFGGAISEEGDGLESRTTPSPATRPSRPAATKSRRRRLR